MSNLILLSLSICFIAYGIYAIIEFLVKRSTKRLIIDLLLGLTFLFLINRLTDFPWPSEDVAFGGGSVLLSLCLLFVFTILGMAANYFFYQEKKFDLRQFLKPILISPMVMLPLIGTLNEYAEINTLQLVSVSFLAFQNGFFWREVIKKVEIKIKDS